MMYDPLAEHIFILTGLILIVLPMLVIAIRESQ